MKKLITSTLTVFTLSGCFWQTVSSYDIEKAAHECKNLENVVEISAHFIGDETVKCKKFGNK